MLGLYLAYEAVIRLFNPSDVAGWTVVIIAGNALMVDLATAALTFAMSQDSQNIRAAFLHNLADAAGSVGVIIAGTAIILFGWNIVDPLVALLIAGYILWTSLSEIGGVIRVLMLGSPPDIVTDDVLDQLAGLDGVADIHHAHLRQMDEHQPALQAHVTIAPGRWSEADAIKDRIKTALADHFNIHHTTLELECARHACTRANRVGHDAPTT